MPTLAVVVVSYASHELLQSNLVRVARDLPEALIVVVDNWSTQAERDLVTEICGREGWVLEAVSENSGFGGGVNRGIARAIAEGADRFLVLNPDAVIGPESVRRLESQVLADPLAMVAPLIRDADGGVWSEGTDLYLDTGDMGSPRRRAERAGRSYEFWLSGAVFIVSEALWQRVGGYDEEFFLYWEDVDLCHRVSAAGGRLVLDVHSEAVHEEGGTHGADARGRAKSSLYYFYNTRNRLLFAAKNLDAASARRWRRGSLRSGYRILLRGGRRQFVESPGVVSAAVRGTWQGMRLGR